MPPGFPLQGSVKLLTSPVVQAGERHRIRVEYTVGDIGVVEGEAIEVWKHFTSDVEEFQVGDPNSPAHFAVETTAPGARLAARMFTNRTQRNTPSVFPYRKTAGGHSGVGFVAARRQGVFRSGRLRRGSHAALRPRTCSTSGS